REAPLQPPQGPEQSVRGGPEGYRRSRGAAGRRDAEAAAAIDAAQAVHDPPRHRQDARQGSEEDLMDPERDAIDYDEIIQRYGRRLFVLAYHLTGTPAEAEELCRECLVRSLLAPDFPTTDKEAGVFLHRGLISLWRERAATAGSVVEIPPASHASLFRALSRLDPVSRAVLVLRVAEGLEYETIGKVLDMAPDVVYARLLQARGGLREGERALESSLFETMNLYLDDRLPPDQRGVFERCIQIDAALRERVEFHRGLTLELHEEAPALPRDFIARLRERLEQTLETLL